MRPGSTKRYFTGTSGWDYRHWKGAFYPPKLPRREWFRFYAGVFDTVEVNYSFYRWPGGALMEKWRTAAPPGFRYSMKAPRTITHVRRLKDVAGKVSEFYDLTHLLGKKMGCHIFQLPPGYVKNETNVSRLKDLLDSLDPGRDNAIEFRHPSWWDDEVYSLLEKNGTAFCCVSGLGMPEDIVATAKTAYFRFHSRRYDTLYGDDVLRRYAERIKELPCRRVYAYFNNDAFAYAAKNARTLEGML